MVTEKRRALNSRLEVRWLDFTARPIHVVEADGRVVLERATEAMDEELDRIPEPASTLRTGALSSATAAGFP